MIKLPFISKISKEHKEKIKNGWQYAQLLILPALIFVIQEMFYKKSNQSSSKSPIIKSHILSLVIIYAIFYLLFGILKTSFRTTVTMSAIVTVIMIINQLKIVYSSNPVFVRDINFLKSPGTFTDILKENLGGIILEMLVPVMLMLAAFIAIGFLAYKFNFVLDKKYRIISAGVSFAFLMFMMLPITATNDLVIKAFFEIDEKKNNNTTSNTKYYYQHGFMAGLVGEYLTTMLREPEGYNKDDVNEMLENVPDDNGSGDNWGKPNIIMVFSESYFDVTTVEEVKFDKDVATNFHQLADEGMLVDMISPVFGGISSNPEYEMLTGGSLKFFPDNYIPYMNLYTNDEYENAPSVIEELNNNGYNTHILSMWSKNLFNVENVYEYFDVKETEFVPSVDEKYEKGGRASDDYVADKIIEAFDNKGEEPLFYMALTAQNHMPFGETKYDEYDISVESSLLPEEETGILKSYAQGVYDADKQLKKLYDYIQKLDEPTMLIFYGDHLPFFKTDSGEDLYEKLEYFNTEDELLNTYRLYNTQCLILDNFGAEYENISYLGYDLVMSYVLNNMDLSLSPYYEWLYTTIDELPAANRHVTIDSEGNLYPTNDLPEDIKEVYENRRKANWNMFVDFY